MSFFDKLILSFCRLGVAGLDPKAPGTWGTAIACLLGSVYFSAAVAAVASGAAGGHFVLGGLASTRAEQLLDRKDPGEVVIDELVGVWLVLLPFQNPGFGLVLAAFAFFRLFDICKPWPVRASENWLPAGFGIMIDDVLAGVWALLCVALLHATGLV